MVSEYQVMQQKQPEYMAASTKGACDYFMTHTTIHGLPNIYESTKRSTKFIWTSVFLFCFGMFCYQVYNMAEQYLRYDKVVKIQIKFEQIQFPAVTICNLNPYKKSAVSSIPSVSSVLHVYETATFAADDEVKMESDLDSSISDETKNSNETLSRKGRDDDSYEIMESYCSGCDTKEGCELFSNIADATRDVKIPNTALCICYKNEEFGVSRRCDKLSNFHVDKCTSSCDMYNFCALRRSASALKGLDCVEHKGRYFNADLLTHFKTEFDWPYDVTSEPSTTEATTTLSATLPTRVFDGDKIVVSEDEVKELETQGYKDVKDKSAIQSIAKENLLWAVSSMSDEQRKAMSFSKEEMILQCSFNGKDCDMEVDFTDHLDATYGNCFVFNGNSSDQRYTKRAGSFYGYNFKRLAMGSSLRLMLFSNQTEYISTTVASGIKMLIHEQDEYPFPDAFGINAATGFKSSFSVRFTRIKNLGAPYGNCIHNKTQRLQSKDAYLYGTKYSPEGCFRSCLQKRIVDKCSCGDVRYPQLPNSQQCSSTDYAARDCVVEETIKVESSETDCQCSQLCEKGRFGLTFSTANWPAKFSKKSVCPKHIPDCINLFKEEASFVEVFYEQINFELMEEQSSYGISNMVSDFGGNMGLWLGASCLSGFEIVLFLLHLCASGCAKCRGESNQNTEKELVIQNLYESQNSTKCSTFVPQTTDDVQIQMD